jgi:hypothetical protein
MDTWIFLDQTQVVELEDAVKRTGWSWLTVYDKIGSSMGEMNAIRQGKRPFPLSTWLPYLVAIGDAVASVEIPERPAPYIPEGTSAVPSIPIDTIANTLGRLFIEAETFGVGERENAQDALSRVAEALGIETDVANTIRGLQQVQKSQVRSGPVDRPVGVLRDAAA